MANKSSSIDVSVSPSSVDGGVDTVPVSATKSVEDATARRGGANDRAEAPEEPLLIRAEAEGLITAGERTLILEEARRFERSPEAVLWSFPEIDTQKLLRLKSELTGVEIFQLEAGTIIPREVLQMVPEETARHYQAAPVRVTGDVLEVGMLNPLDVIAEEALRFLASSRNLKLKKWLIAPKDFKEALRQYRSLREEVGAALENLEEEIRERPRKDGAETEQTRREKMVEDAPLTKTVAVILKYATEGRASDIHIEPMVLSKKTRVRFRMDGILHTSLYVPLEVHPGIVARIKVLSDMKIDETRVPQDGRFRTVIEDRAIDFRVSTFPQIGGEKIVMRILDPAIGLQRLEGLGLVGHSLEVVKQALERPFGMFLITGPTGSGKSTTLNGILRILNQESDNIVTLEDPVEYYLEGISQSEIRPEIGYTFAAGLRHILRQDPDIIMVGEIRDLETAALAVHAALTGHLLFSTLHTNTATGVIPRLINMKLEPFLLPATLNVALGQRLVKRLCPFCKKETPLQKETQEIVDAVLAGLPKTEHERLKAIGEKKFYKPVGCKHCGRKGTKGRVAIYEALEMTPALEELITADPNETKIAEEAKRQGMVTIKQDGVLKALEGLVSLEEVLQSVE